MTHERAVKAFERLDACGAYDGFGDYMEKEEFKRSMISNFEQLDESEVRPDLIQLLDMSDFQFKLRAPAYRIIVRTAIKANQKAIERRFKKMMNETV